MAYCLWLSEQTAQQILLPTEQQWQRAGQGDDGRTYAWGNEEPDDQLANWNKNVGQTTPVDSYALQAERQTYGLYNMTGNVWEWCLTDYDTGSQAIKDKSEFHVLRGGSWLDQNPGYLRLAYRLDWVPHWQFNLNGFRLARQ